MTNENDVQIVFDIKKVAYMELYWKSLTNPAITRAKKPHGITVNGEHVSEDTMSPDGKRMIDIAFERGLVDKWSPVVTVHLLYGKTLTFSGDRGMEIWRKWCDLQFNKK